VGVSGTGQIFGGYTSKAWNKVSSYASLAYINDPEAFLFSLTSNKQVKVEPGYSAQAISVRPAQPYTFNDWGYETLHIKVNTFDNAISQGACQGYSNINYNSAYKFYGKMTQNEFVGSLYWFNINSLETFQVTFY
jgi:hypothetical protein